MGTDMKEDVDGEYPGGFGSEVMRSKPLIFKRGGTRTKKTTITIKTCKVNSIFIINLFYVP
jgi:hypothetical protein